MLAVVEFSQMLREGDSRGAPFTTQWELDGCIAAQSCHLTMLAVHLYAAPEAYRFDRLVA